VVKGILQGVLPRAFQRLLRGAPSGLLGRKTPPLRGFWQERFHHLILGAKAAFWASQKPQERSVLAFPKQACVDTYASHPIGFGPGRLLRKPPDGSIGAVFQALAGFASGSLFERHAKV
jgi:hypothetical protein